MSDETEGKNSEYEYAKEIAEHICIKLDVSKRGSEYAEIHHAIYEERQKLTALIERLKGLPFHSVGDSTMHYAFELDEIIKDAEK